MGNKILTVALVNLVLVGAVRADEIVLKNGRTLQGRVLSREDGRVVISVAGGSMTLKESQILEIKESLFVYQRSQRLHLWAPELPKFKPTKVTPTRYARVLSRLGFLRPGKSPWASNRQKSGGGLAGIARNAAARHSGRRGSTSLAAQAVRKGRAGASSSSGGKNSQGASRTGF